MNNNLEKIKYYLKEISRLSLPIVISYIAIGMMGIVDTMIVGNYETTQLAYMGLANAIFGVLFTVPMGLLQGVVIKSSQKFGAKKFASCGKIYNEGKKYSILLSVIFVIIGLNSSSILSLLDQSAIMIENTTPILLVLTVSIPFILIYANANFFLQSIKRPHIAMYGIISANILNLIINPVLVFGWLGFPAMGALGAATTTLIIRIALAVYMLYYIYKMKRDPKLNKRFGLDRSYETWWNDSKTTRKVGYGIALVVIAANGSFSLVSTFASWFGQEMMATFVIIINVNTLIFMILFAISQATSIVAANAYGKKDIEGLSCVLKSSYLVYFAVMLVIQAIVNIFPDYIFGIFTNDAQVMITINSLLIYFLIDVFIDTLPLNLVSTLNGRGDVKIPSINQAFSFLVVRIFASYYLGITLNMGIKGLVIGLACGGLSSFILNSIRYLYIVNKDIKPTK